MVKWALIRSELDYCFPRRGHVRCTGRQMRNGFFLLNLLAWFLIILAACALV